MSRIAISEKDARRMREVVHLSLDDGGPMLPWSFLTGLQELIGCDAIAFNGVDSRAEQHYFSQFVLDDSRQWEMGESSAGEDSGFWAHYWSSPCSYQEASGDLTAVTMISDFLSGRQWRASGMYADCLGPEVEHEMWTMWPDGSGRTLRLLCPRGAGRDFGERERFLLLLLRPHIADAYRSAVRRRALGQLTGRQQEILDLVRTGLTNRQIARRLEVSEGTVRTHLNHIFTRLDVGSRTAAAAFAGTPAH